VNVNNKTSEVHSGKEEARDEAYVERTFELFVCSSTLRNMHLSTSLTASLISLYPTQQPDVSQQYNVRRRHTCTAGSLKLT